MSPESKQSDKNCSQPQSNEVDDQTILSESDISGRVQNINSDEKSIQFKNVTAIWEHSENPTQVNGIYDVTIKIGPGLSAIVGAVGTGKSTLLNAILGELELDAGALVVNGSISYSAQDPWLFNGTVRNNIIFVDDFDQQRYNTVVKVCALQEDFQQFPQGDGTIIGEKGISLSGGQKARVNLARAIYKRADVYLLDDPLSAVDMHVDKHIFERCIEDFLGDKICVLVTHQLQYLKSIKHVVLLANGRVEAEGPFDTLDKFNEVSLMHAQEDIEPDANASNRMVC